MFETLTESWTVNANAKVWQHVGKTRLESGFERGWERGFKIRVRESQKIALM